MKDNESSYDYLKILGRYLGNKTKELFLEAMQIGCNRFAIKLPFRDRHWNNIEIEVKFIEPIPSKIVFSYCIDNSKMKIIPEYMRDILPFFEVKFDEESRSIVRESNFYECYRYFIYFLESVIMISNFPKLSDKCDTEREVYACIKKFSKILDKFQNC